MKKFLQRTLRQPILSLAEKYSSHPEKEAVHAALTALYERIVAEPGKRGLVVPFDCQADSFIILSDQHKGCKDGADDFAIAERNYLCALDHYYENGFHLVALGDVEELWENSLANVKKSNVPTLSKEVLFAQQQRFTKLFGNHDLYWDNDPFAPLQLEQMFGQKLRVYEGMILQTKVKENVLNIFLTHGHQGDKVSDGNWFSKWFIANVWAPVQAYLGINPNTPAYDTQLKTVHNRLMYEWVSQQENMLLVTGHTHQPVFKSFTHLELLYDKLAVAQKANDMEAIETLQHQIGKKKDAGQSLPDFSAYKPWYFNSGCCCFDDGDITGIELAAGSIRLVKWEYDSANTSRRFVLEETSLDSLMQF